MSCKSNTTASICKRSSSCSWVRRKKGDSFCRKRRSTQKAKSHCSGKNKSVCARKSGCKWATGSKRSFCRVSKTRRARKSARRIKNKKSRAMQAVASLFR